MSQFKRSVYFHFFSVAKSHLCLIIIGFETIFSPPLPKNPCGEEEKRFLSISDKRLFEN